jgi:hypothetical protein
MKGYKIKLEDKIEKKLQSLHSSIYHSEVFPELMATLLHYDNRELAEKVGAV